MENLLTVIIWFSTVAIVDHLTNVAVSTVLQVHINIFGSKEGKTRVSSFLKDILCILFELNVL